jgi:hypothetical protein
VSENYEFIMSGAGDYTLIADGSLLIDATRLEWARGDDLRGEVTITTESGSMGPFSLALMRAASRREVLASISDDRASAALNELCRRVIQAERTSSSPIVCLRDVPRPSADKEYSVPLLPSLPRTTMAIWFGDGGTGKSLLALHTAGHLAKQGIRTLYLDWEWDAAEHRDRYEQLFGAEMPAGLFYWRCDRPLPQMSDAIRRAIRDRQIGYVVVDSIAYACGGDPESGETASRYSQHARSFEVGSLHLAHVSKAGNTDKPFGSVFWHNSARSTWYIEAGETRRPRDGISETDLRWHHRKSNYGALEQEGPLVRINADKSLHEIRLTTRAPLTRVKALSAPERIKLALAHGPMSRDDLRHMLHDVRPDALRRAIGRGINEEDGWLREGTNRMLYLTGTLVATAA